MFRAVVQAGKLLMQPQTRQRFVEWMAGHEGAAVTITHEIARRSLSQNAYYWLFLGVIERETGQPADELHEWAKRKFLPPRFITVRGEEMKIPGSTKNLSKSDFNDYLDKLSAAVEIALPDPVAAGYLPH